MAQLIEIMTIFGVPEALLSDRGTNFLSSLGLDLCKLLGIEKLNTTAYHPQCNGMVEYFNRTSRECRESMLPSLVSSGTGTCLDFYGLIKAPHTSPLERSHLSCCLALTCSHQQKVLSCHQLLHQRLEWRSLITGRKQPHHCPQLEKKLPKQSRRRN